MLKEMSIEVIRKCPNHCVHCSSSSSVECNDIIPFDTFKKVIDGSVNLHLQTLCFSGGEPFLHPNIIQMVKYVSSKNIQSYIYTSGIFINENSIRSSIPKEILLQLKKDVTKLIFNIEAVSSDAYNQIMGTHGCFPYLKQSIIDAVNLGIVCEAHFVPMKLNIDEIERTIQFCEDIGISQISFLRLVPHGRAFSNKELILLNDNELEVLKSKLAQLQKHGNHSIRIGVPLSESKSAERCEAAFGKLNIKYDGYVYPCEAFKNIPNSISRDGLPENIFEKTIDNIYHQSSYLNNIRDYIASFCQSNNCENCVGQFYIQS